MRNRTRYGLLAGAVSIGALVFAAIAMAANVSTLDFAFNPNEVPKKDYKKGSLFVHTTTDTDPAGGFPSPTTNVDLDFDDDFKFTTKGVPKCTEPISTMNTADAIAACQSSVVSISGSATVRTPGPVNVPAVVTAFNGPKQNDHPTILLHTRVGGATTIVLVGELQPSPLGGDFGKRLHVPVPPTGTAIVDFQTTVKKKDYVSARCKDDNKRWNVRADFTYQDLSSETVNDTQACKRA
jgi:hypothetical protein